MVYAPVACTVLHRVSEFAQTSESAFTVVGVVHLILSAIVRACSSHPIDLI